MLFLVLVSASLAAFSALYNRLETLGVRALLLIFVCSFTGGGAIGLAISCVIWERALCTAWFTVWRHHRMPIGVGYSYNWRDARTSMTMNPVRDAA